MKILVVEDSPSDIALITATLSPVPGMDATLVSHLADAIACLQNGVFDVVLTDLGLPDSSGIATAHALYPHLADGTALVVLTGTGSDAVGLQALRSGAQDYLDKTHLGHPELLRRCLTYAVERRRHLSEILGLRKDLALARGTYHAQNARVLDDLAASAAEEAARGVGKNDERTLVERTPGELGTLLTQYDALLERGIAARLTQRADDVRVEMEAMARALGSLRAEARDVVRMHMSAMESKVAEAKSAQKMAIVIGEGRLRLVELLGYLSNYYRRQLRGPGD